MADGATESIFASSYQQESDLVLLPHLVFRNAFTSTRSSSISRICVWHKYLYISACHITWMIGFFFFSGGGGGVLEY